VSEAALVGRDDELTALAEGLAAAQNGSGRTMLLGGEGGVGKTALLRHFVAQSGATALWGTTPVAAGERLPYAPFVDLLRALEHDLPAALKNLGEARRDVAPLLPITTDVAAAVPTDPFARLRLVDALRVIIEQAADQRPPLVVILDDLHWADDASLAVLSYLVQQLRATPVLLVATYRSDALEDEPGLGPLLAELIRLEHVSHIELRGLSVDELLRIEADCDTNPAPDELRTLAARAAGNPFMFGQLVAAANGAQGSLPRDLRQLLLARVSALPPFVRAVAQACAVAGRSATSALISALLPGRHTEVISALRLLVRSAVLDPPSALGEPYAFHHPLMQEAVIDDLLPDERAGLHRRIAAVLESETTPSAEPAALVEAAIHWAAADDPTRAMPALIAGAQAAQQLHAFELAHTFLEQALGLTAASGGGTMAAQLRLRAAEAAYLSGHVERATELAKLARQGLIDDHAATARVLERTGWYQLAAGDVGAALAAFAEAAELALASDSGDRGRALASYGRGLMLAGRYGEAVGVLEQAVDLARQSGLPADESRALNALGVALVRLGRAEAGILRIDEARQLDEQRGESLAAPRPSRIGYLIGSLLDRATVLEASGELSAASAETQEASELARQLGGVGAFGGVIALRSAHEAFLLGRWSEVDDALATAAPVPPAERVARAVMRARLECARGSVADAAAALEEAQTALALTTPPTLLVALQTAAAEIALARNRPADAVAAVDEALAMGVGEDQVALAELVTLGLRADADRAELARLRRSGGEVEAIREHGLTISARAGMAAPGETGDDAPRGRVAALRLLCEAELGRLAGSSDAERWGAAAGAFTKVSEPYNAAYSRWREAEALLVARRDRRRAEEALRQAHETVTELGAAGLAAEVEALARRSRVDLAAAVGDSPAVRDEAGPAEELGLSARELEVLLLVAEGRTNRQIGEALFITEKTAGHHVSSILTKLGLASRVEAAAVAHRRGLLEQPVSTS